MHKGIEGRADRFDDLRSSRLVRVLKNAADETEPGEVLDQRLFGQGAGHIDRTKLNVG